MEKIITVEDLHKSYQKREILKGINFTIDKGEIFAMLGPNGAGKSTTMNILSTSLKKSSGTVTIDGLTLGRNDLDIKRRIGIVFQDGVLDDALTIEENLYVRGRLYGLHGDALSQRIERLSEMTGTGELLNRKYEQLSGGQRRRCDIARALLHLPKLLFLDEPTTGLDPEMRTAVWDTINNIRAHSDMTILLTTHYMEEATLADHIIFLKDGKIAANGTPRELKTSLTSDLLVLYSNNIVTLQRILEVSGQNPTRHNDRIEIPIKSTIDALPILDNCKGRFSSFEVRCGNLEDAYISIIEGDSLNV